MKRKRQKTEVVYSENILYRAKILDLLRKKKISQVQAAKELGLKSDRQIRNLLKRYQEANCRIIMVDPKIRTIY